MPVVQELKLHLNSNEVEDTRHRMRLLDGELTELERSLDTLLRRNPAHYLHAFQSEILTALRSIDSPNANHWIDTFLEEARRHILGPAESTQIRADEYRSHISRNRDRHAQRQRDLTRLVETSEPIILKAPEIRRDLSALDHIPSSSVRLVKYDESNGGPDVGHISFRFTGLKMKPSSNPYYWLDEGHIPTIALPDITVKILLPSNSIKIYRTDDASGDAAPRLYDGARTPHPHILTDNSPCFGDWGAIITELLQDYQDFRAFAEVLQTFFQTCNNDDAAGRTWINFVTHTFEKQCAELGFECYDSGLINYPPKFRFASASVRTTFDCFATTNNDGEITFYAPVPGEDGTGTINLELSQITEHLHNINSSTHENIEQRAEQEAEQEAEHVARRPGSRVELVQIVPIDDPEDLYDVRIVPRQTAA